MSPINSPREAAERHFVAMATGDLDLAGTVLDPGHVNHMAPDHPPASAQPGLRGFAATSAWLRLAFGDLRFDILELVADERTTIAQVTMSGEQTGPFVVFPPGEPPASFPPTGRRFAVRQCHVFHHRNGLHLDHSAVRDDLGMMMQLGHLPPSPGVAVRMAAWHLGGGHRRAVRTAVAVAQDAARSTEPAVPTSA